MKNLPRHQSLAAFARSVRKRRAGTVTCVWASLRLFGPIAVVVILNACGWEGEEAPLSAAFMVRDSAGVEIIESEAPSWSTDEGWSLGLQPLFVLEEFDGSEVNRLLDPTSIDVDGRGRIIVGDGNQAGWHAILVYDSLGQFQFQAGRKGQGPGEFGQLWWASAYREDSLVAFDMVGRQLSVFGPEGEFARSVRIPQLDVPRGPRGSFGFVPGADAAYRDGHFLAYPSGALDPKEGVGPAWQRHLLLRLDPTGRSWDTLGTFEISQQYWTGTSQEQLWFAPIPRLAVSSDRLYFGRGERFEIHEYDARGALKRIFGRSYEPRPVTDRLREQLRDWYLDRLATSPEVNEQVLDRIRTQMESARFTEFLPPYSDILFDPSGYLWIEEFRWLPYERSPIVKPTQWAVFNLDGVWLGNVETPDGFILRKVTKNRAYGFVIDESDVKEIHIYDLIRGQ